jgi:hypothetical protein
LAAVAVLNVALVLYLAWLAAARRPAVN